MSKTKLLAAFAAATLALTVMAPSVRAVDNPFQATLTISVGPENPAAGTLYYSINSTCNNHSNPIFNLPACGGDVAIPQFTVLGTKCNNLVADMNVACVNGADKFIITNNCGQNPPNIIVTDPFCTTANDSSKDGLVFGISNQDDLLKNSGNPTALVDYEFDTITHGGARQGFGDVAVLLHNAGGTATSGATSFVLAAVKTPGGFNVTTQFNTHAGDTPTTVLNALASQVNSQHQGVTCEVVKRALMCMANVNSLVPDALGDSAPLSLQLNDQSLSRASLSGPPTLVQKLVQTIDTPSAPLISGINVVSGGAAVPALSSWAMLVLIVALATVAFWRIRGRGLRPASRRWPDRGMEEGAAARGGLARQVTPLSRHSRCERVAGARRATRSWSAVLAVALSIFQLGSGTHLASPPSGTSDVGGAPSECTPVPPTVTANPQASGPTSPQTTDVFEITVANNDRGSCGARLLLLSVDSLPPHVITFVQPSLVGVLPGETGRILLAVTADTSAAPGILAVPFRIRDLGLTDQVTGVVTYDLRLGSPCLVRPDRELFVRDLSVVEAPIRTMGGGAWTFGHLARHLAVTEGEAPAMIEQLFRTWLSTQMVNDLPVAARPGMKPFLLDRWPRSSDGSLDLDRAPLRLLAIVNRIDLRSTRRERAGEARFVFNVIGADGGPSLFNLILEYSLPAHGVPQVLEWAHRWHALAALPFPSEEYNAALERITERIITARGAGSGLASLRTNDFSLAQIWELRQFGPRADGLLHEEPVALTPDTGFLGGDLLADFVNGREGAILHGNLTVPLRFGGVPFRGGSSLNMLQAWNAPGLRNPEARHVFSVNTCNGCHSRPETGTNFLHVEPRAAGTVAVLSGFLQGMAVIDPFSGEVRVFNDVGRRKADMEKLVCDDDEAAASEEIFRVH